METTQEISPAEKCQRACRLAHEKYRSEPDWVTFYREVLGVNGIVDRLFPTFDQRSEFEKTDEYSEIQQLLAKLRERNRVQKDADEPTRVITVRLPQSLHEALRHEAHNYKTSMNKLCISKLLQVVEDELIPSDFEKRQVERNTATTQPEATAHEVPSRSSHEASSGQGIPRPTHTASYPATQIPIPTQRPSQYSPRQVPPPHYGDQHRSF